MAWADAKMGAADDAPLEPGYRFHHGCRVARLALNLAHAMELTVDTETLYIAGVLHDAGKSGGQSGAGHGPRGAEIIRTEIAHLFTEAELAAVCYIVSNHYMRPNSGRFDGQPAPEFPHEILLIQDADIIDHYGYSGIYLNLYWSAHLRRTPSEILDRFYSEEADIERMCKPLNYSISRVELIARWETAKRFYERLAKEEAGELMHAAP